MTSKTKPTVSAAIDADNDITSPLDFSYKCLAGIQDAMDEEPRAGPHKFIRVEKYDEAGNVEVKYKANSLRFCYNAISDLQSFCSTLEHFLEDPSDLGWLDLSFNDISTIDEVILQYPNIKILYLHSNDIKKLSEIDKLAALPELRKITLHGNPIEDLQGYRQYVISTLPRLKTLDFVAVTNQDRSDAMTWRELKSKKK